MTFNLQEKALTLVAQYAQEKNPEKTFKIDDFHVINFTGALLNWEAVIEKKIFDGMYYRVIYNGYTAELYLNVYAQTDYVGIPDQRN